VCELHRRANRQLAAVRLLLADDHLEQRGLPRAVRADHTDDAPLRQIEVQVVEEQVVAVGFLQILRADHEVAERRAVGNLNHQVLFAFVEFLSLHLLDAGEAGLVLADASPRAHPRPFEFARQLLLPGALGFLLVFEALFLLLHPTGVVPLEGVAAAAVQFQNPLRDVIEESSGRGVTATTAPA